MTRQPYTFRRVRFSIRALLLVVLAVALASSWLQRGRAQRDALQHMLASNPSAALLYDYEVDAAGGLNPSAAPPGPEWLRDRLGRDYLSSVVGADVFYPTDADLACLARFPKLRRLHLERSVDLTDEGLAQLARLTQLKRLVLGEADQVSDAGLLHLARLKQMAELRLDAGRRMTPEGIQRLRLALPNCRIEIRDSPANGEVAAVE